ncbi:MAG: hypothetical protein GTO17_01960 [Candidatus Aminicenantes bacterium]|nr:hypothetical protein [Candidatus Aminicenantes bacterium]
MRKKCFFFIIFFNLCLYAGAVKISCLSEIFLLGKGIQDSDGDNLGDKVSLQIIIPDSPSAYELAVAADMAARANLESLALDFLIVRKESEIQKLPGLENPIFIGSNLKLVKEMQKKEGSILSQLKSHQGLVLLFSYAGQEGVALIAGSEKALLETGRSFFLRWPYLWEIWGREQGATYFSLKEDVINFLTEQGIPFSKITIKSALYEFPPQHSVHQSLKRLKFRAGEIKNLSLEIEFADKKDRQKASEAFQSLRLQHRQGQNTEVLSYPGCAQITFELRENNKKTQMSIARLSYPKRHLTPSYKAPLKVKSSGKDFDLTNLFSTRGFYSDSDQDKILDGLNTSIIIPQDFSLEGIVPLASRLVLHSAGASFPLVFLDDEVENRKALLAPVLVGESNELNQRLLKTGKLKLPVLEKGFGSVKVVPKAFNKSSALTITGADRFTLEKTLLYLSKTFPYFEDYEEGKLQLKDVLNDVEEFLKGKGGSAEAYFYQYLKYFVDTLKGKKLDHLRADFLLPRKDQKFEERTKEFLEGTLDVDDLKIKVSALQESKKIFEKEKEFTWEADEALNIIRQEIEKMKGKQKPLSIELGLSESTEVRQKIKRRVEELFFQNNIQKFEVTVLSAYKQGFFWLLEKALPSLKARKLSRLVIKFALERDDFSQLKRFYSEPYRWLQELYPVDEILSQELQLPLDKIEFQAKEEKEPIYELLAYDKEGNLFFQQAFSPRRRVIPFLRVLPEWGKVKVTTGWLKIDCGGELMVDESLKTDLEKFWDFYQDEVLAQVYSYVMKKTENEPSFSKQPYFKKLMVEMWFSEPDYKLGLNEEIVSSLESIHDEIYFDTLDFLRGITEIKGVEEEDLPEDTSRLSAPGNVLPLVHPSLEGGNGKVKVIFEDWLARSPRLVLKWKEAGREEYEKKLVFSPLEAKSVGIPSFIFNGPEEQIQTLLIELEMEKEKDYLELIEILHSWRALQEKKFLLPSFQYPKLKSLTIKIKHKELDKEEILVVSSPRVRATPLPTKKKRVIIPTDRIISPQMCLDIIDDLGQSQTIRTYIGGRSYENRKIPVLEIFLPLAKHVSLPRLVTFKPTLYISGRQHANEVSSTNYILKLAEHLKLNKTYQEYLKKMNLVLHPLENPDGAELAYQLQKITPFHSLHAGRYTSLGIDVGYQVNVSKPILPEAKVRGNLYRKWQPDIYLNLHGYPSHEWVQQFSNYSPYLFRDYWIPRGWFAYFRALHLPLYQKWKEAGESLRGFIIQEMKSDAKINESNQNFYDRYARWASRWQPHLSYLEIYDSLNIYSKRRSSREAKLTARRRTTFAEEVPELMDETARGEWLDFLCQQGLAYLRAHLKYLARVDHEIARIEEEINDRILVQFLRSRPGALKKTNKK